MPHPYNSEMVHNGAMRRSYTSGAVEDIATKADRDVTPAGYHNAGSFYANEVQYHALVARSTAFLRSVAPPASPAAHGGAPAIGASDGAGFFASPGDSYNIKVEVERAYNLPVGPNDRVKLQVKLQENNTDLSAIMVTSHSATPGRAPRWNTSRNAVTLSYTPTVESHAGGYPRGGALQRARYPGLEIRIAADTGEVGRAAPISLVPMLQPQARYDGTRKGKERK